MSVALGDGPPLVMLHGIARHAHTFDHLAADLARDYSEERWLLAAVIEYMTPEPVTISESADVTEAAGDEYVSAEHLLLGILDEKAGAVTLDGSAGSIDDVSAFLAGLTDYQWHNRIDRSQIVIQPPIAQRVEWLRTFQRPRHSGADSAVLVNAHHMPVPLGTQARSRDGGIGTIRRIACRSPE